MMKNIGNMDRILRFVLGAALIAAGVILQVNSGRFWWLVLIGAVPFVTASLGTCPLYMILKIKTNK